MYCDFQRPTLTWMTEQVRYQIQRATFHDLHALADLLTTCFHSKTHRAWFYPLLRLGVCEDLRQRLKNAGPHYACWTAWQQGFTQPDPWLLPRPPLRELVGTVEVDVRHPAPWAPGGSWRSQAGGPTTTYPYVSNLAVSPTARRRGIARHLLQMGEQTARHWGFSKLYLHVLENNSQARQLYAEAGYRQVRVDAHWLGQRLGRPRQLFLEKDLAPDLEAQTH
ncbi:MAG: GNAT family N-acetyltransferase [Prochlorothrix sp.]|nr:GNAT family N-acetyltransferase [Prochlorothrix sp.]